jgi:hypothetical protein
MSAFVVSNDHIDALLTFAIDKRASYNINESCGRMSFAETTATEIGRVLLRENERSVNQRYQENDAGIADSYEWRRFPNRRLTPVNILKACSCFDYQACETDDYEESVAHRIIDAIRHTAIGSLPGYNDADGWTFARRADEPEQITLSSMIRSASGSLMLQKSESEFIRPDARRKSTRSTRP